VLPLVVFALLQQDLDTLVQKIHSADPGERLAAAQKIAEAPPEAMELLAKRLLVPPRSSVDTFRKLVLEVWGQVPNWKSGDPMWIRKPEPPLPPRVKGQPRPKRPPPHDPETTDWLTALNDVQPAQAATLDPIACIPLEKGQKLPPEPSPTPSPSPEPDWQEARAEAMEKVALIRGIAHSRRLDAVDPIFQLAFVLDGVFRDECGRQIRSMDSYAVPRLVRLMHQTGPVAARLGKQRRYAAYQLDRMDRQRPQKAIATAPDDMVRAEIIHAYGEEQALDAVEAVLAQVDSPSHRVRREARWAWLRYVTGKPPPPAPKRKRKLGGGREEEEEKPDYLTYREIATLALQKEVPALTGTPLDPKKSAAELTTQLFAFLDARHAAEWDALFQSAKTKESAGDFQAATDDYGWILAHDPNYDKRAQMAPAFLQMGERLLQQDQLPRAVGYFRQGLDLDPTGPAAAKARAHVAECDRRLAPPVESKKWLHAGESAVVVLLLLGGLWLLWRRTQPLRS
jgi:tetratricopeptide (TPR) repeat protein